MRATTVIIRGSISAIIFLGLAFIPFTAKWGCWAEGGNPDTIPWDAHEKVVQALESKITTYQIGVGAVVLALVTAIGILWASLGKKEAKLEEKDQVLVSEVKSLASIRMEMVQAMKDQRAATERLTEAIESLEKKIEYCPARQHRETEAELDRG